MNPTFPPTPEMESLKRIYDAINRNDLDACVRDFDVDIERVEPPGFPTAGTYRGIDAVRAHIAQGRGTWAEGTCEPVRAIVVSDKVVLFCHIHVRLKGKTDWVEGDIADVWTFRNGKAIGFRTFGEPDEGLAWARANDPGPKGASAT